MDGGERMGLHGSFSSFSENLARVSDSQHGFGGWMCALLGLCRSLLGLSAVSLQVQPSLGVLEVWIEWAVALELQLYTAVSLCPVTNSSQYQPRGKEKCEQWWFSLIIFKHVERVPCKIVRAHKSFWCFQACLPHMRNLSWQSQEI